MSRAKPETDAEVAMAATLADLAALEAKVIADYCASRPPPPAPTRRERLRAWFQRAKARVFGWDVCEGCGVANSTVRHQELTGGPDGLSCDECIDQWYEDQRENVQW